MAANEYYHGQEQRPYDNTPSPAPYYSGHNINTPSPQSTPAPAYQSAYTAPAPSYSPAPDSHGAHMNQPAHQAEQSPFDTVFDDHVYPVSSRPTPAGSSTDMSQQGLYHQDTGYYGQDSYGQPQHGQDIPLQDRPIKDAEMDDHIYDRPPGASRKKSKKGKVRLGELGMFGADKKRIPWIVYFFSLVQIGVFIGEIVRNATLTGSPIMIKPQFNPMIGPSTQVMINMGARYVPCMHNVDGIQNSEIKVLFLCPNATKNTQTCPLNVLCGFDGKVPNPKFDGDDKQTPQPNQWYRFIIPIFMHAGLIHIGFNLLLQLTIAKEMEMAIGSIRFFLVYMSAGIFGFVMGGNYAAPGIASTGASGSLFGIIALTLLDLLYSWKERKSPVKDLMFILLDMIISFVLGLLPGLDNFSHIGGFLMGLSLGVCILHSPNSLRRKMGQELSYATVSENTGDTPPGFLKNPVGFFKGRKPLWWAWWLIRAGFLVMIIVVFIVLLKNFYSNHKTCEWCKYLSCIPVNGWCDIGTIKET
ncbi:Fc.00g052130.m01.CDS01 [Cosmosporella sp. VM-42]